MPDLVFKRSRATTTNPTTLIFGSGTVVVSGASLSGAPALPQVSSTGYLRVGVPLAGSPSLAPLKVYGRASVVVQATIQATTPSLVVLGKISNTFHLDSTGKAVLHGVISPGSMLYASNTSRPTTYGPRSSWSWADTTRGSWEEPYQESSSFKNGVDTPWSKSTPGWNSTTGSYADSAPCPVQQAQPWGKGAPIEHSSMDGFDDAMAIPLWASLQYQEAMGLGAGVTGGFQDMDPLPRTDTLPWGRGGPIEKLLWMSATWAKPLPVIVRLVATEAVPPPPGGDKSIVVVPPEDLRSTDLIFSLLRSAFPSPTTLIFSKKAWKPGKVPGGDTKTTITIAALGAYFMLNSMSLTRSSDGVQIGITDGSAGIDFHSWGWSFQGTIRAADLPLVIPSEDGLVPVEFNINGIVISVVIDSYSYNREFAPGTATISGKSQSLYLDAPYAQIRSYQQVTDMTSIGYATQELTRAGLNTGFSLDWLLPDNLGWQMPAGTYSYQDLPPLQVIKKIVEGAGGYINTHHKDPTLIVRPQYPLPFWSWGDATPDMSIPWTIIKAESCNYLQNPLYNGVYVSGEQTGVSAFVKKSGTAGDYQSPACVDPMISDAIAARLRGTSILSTGGRQATMGLTLPMESSLGLILPGTLIEVTNGGIGDYPTWRGLTRGVTLRGSSSQNTITATQTITLERHYGGF